MKKIGLIFIIALFILPGIYAQKIEDALRNSQVFYYGTARFMGMGGAFTALGGDLSSLSQNPAGLGVFRSSEVSITPQLFHIKTSADIDTDLPISADLNNPENPDHETCVSGSTCIEGAKIWLVLSSDVDCNSRAMVGWDAEEYLFEDVGISFDYIP